MALLDALRRRLSLFAGALLLVTSPSFAGQALAGEPMPLEDAVKAAYVYKFAPFVAWPAPLPAGAPFVICALGNDRVSALLPQVTEGQRIEERPIRIRALAESESAGDCRILYVAATAAAGPVLDSLQGKPILTVTSAANAHAIIRLVTVSRHVSFDIDAKLASEDGLGISSKLLGLARNVARPAENPP
jgi:hypothetical protein